MEWLKSLAGKVASGAVALGVIVAAIAWFQADPAARSVVVSSTLRAIGWFLAVIVLPFALIPLLARVAKMQSNAASACLIGGLSAIEIGTLLALFGVHDHGGAFWTFAVAGSLLAIVYNVLCGDWLAERFAD